MDSAFNYQAVSPARWNLRGASLRSSLRSPTCVSAVFDGHINLIPGEPSASRQLCPDGP
jgi:hypothetical protein